MNKATKRLELSLFVGMIVLAFVIGIMAVYVSVDHSLYDLLLRFRKPPEERTEILLLDFDDTAIQEVGTFPVSRSIMGEGLLLMREMGARYAVFDIEYLEASPRGINQNFLDTTASDAVEELVGNVQFQTEQLLEAIGAGQLEIKADDPFSQQIIQQMDSLFSDSKSGLLDVFTQVSQDNDEYLGKSAAVFQNAFLTVNIDEGDFLPDEDTHQLLRERYIYKKIDVADKNKIPGYTYLQPVIDPILSRAEGIGFTNVVVDDDGVRRRIHLIREVDGDYYLQLAFSPLIHWLGNPDIEVDDEYIVLKNAVDPDSGESRSYTIPLENDGTMLINWLKEDYYESFRHLSFGDLMLNKKLEDLIIRNLKQRADWGYLNAYQGETGLLEIYNYVLLLKEELLESDGSGDEARYFETRDFFFGEVQSFVAEETEQMLLEFVEINYSQGYLDESGYQIMKEDIPHWFSIMRETMSDFYRNRNKLAEALDGSYCILGFTATGTTDLGVNPFHEAYVNVGTHASITNTILNEDYLRTANWLISFLISLALSVLLFFMSSRLQPQYAILSGLGTLVLAVVALTLVFVASGVMISLYFPLLMITFTFVLTTIFSAVSMFQERNFIRNAFSHYMSAEVIKDIVENPDKLALGGENRDMTVVFTDVKGFSTISEQMTAEDLVRLLNMYLTEMSNIILDEQGTIDKYEGDAIMAFFGAPIDQPDHAIRACRAAIKMKLKETELTERFLTEGKSPNPVLTRIGINSGEMVVGNMGTTRKMDYTVMGNSVNLAARLEGVNKLYATWIMASDFTVQRCNDEFFFRKLNKVRVIGINTPVRIYEVVGFQNDFSAEDRRKLAVFEEAVDLMESRDWKQSLEGFRDYASEDPADETAKFFISRVNQFTKTPPPEDWDGVFQMKGK